MKINSYITSEWFPEPTLEAWVGISFCLLIMWALTIWLLNRRINEIKFLKEVNEDLRVIRKKLFRSPNTLK